MTTRAPKSNVLIEHARRLRRARTCQQGAALVEFAVVLPVLMLILMSVLLIGQAFNESTNETHLAEVAVRYAAVNQDPGGGIVSYIKNLATTTGVANPTVCVSFPNGTSNVGDPVQVTISSVYSWIPLLSQDVFGGATTTTLVRSATMRLEAPPSYGAGC